MILLDMWIESCSILFLEICLSRPSRLCFDWHMWHKNFTLEIIELLQKFYSAKMPRPQSSYFLSVSRDVLCFLRFWIVLCIYLLCIYREQSYGSHREMQINKTRSPTVEKNIMDDNLQGGPLKHVQETHFLFSLFFFFVKIPFI